MKNSYILTIAIPVYNMENYIRRCLDSIVNSKTFDNIEIIAINDGSTDKSENIIKKEYCQKFSKNLKLINKRNGGHGSAINEGILHASGKYFKVVDADDWLDTKKLDEHIDLLKDAKYDLVFTNYCRCSENNIKNKIDYSYAKIIDDCCYKNFNKNTSPYVFTGYIHMHSITYKTQILKKNNIKLLEHTFYVDQEYITKPIPFIKNIHFQNISLYQYYIGREGQSISIEQLKKREADHERVLKSLINYYKENFKKFNDYNKQYYLTILWHHVNTHCYILKLKNKSIFYAIKKIYEYKNIDKKNFLIQLKKIINERKNEIKIKIKSKIKNIYQKININYRYLNYILEQNNFTQNNIRELRNENIEIKNLVNNLVKKNDKEIKKILIVGYYGAPNMGDEIMLKSLINILDNKFEISILFAEKNKEYNTSQWNNVDTYYMPKSLKKLNEIIEKHDAVYIGGGALIDDSYYDIKKSYKWHLPALIIKLAKKFIAKNKPVYFIGVSCNENISNINYINDLKTIINKSKLFTVRDKFSKIEIEKKCSVSNIPIFNDLAFYLKYPKIENKKNTIGFIIFDHNNETEKIVNLLDDIYAYIRDHIDWEIDIISLCELNNGSKNHLAKIISQSKLSKINYNLTTKFNNTEEALKVLTSHKIVISMRYHSSLISMYNKIPTINIIYDKHPHYTNKMRHLINIFNMENFSTTYTKYKKGWILKSIIKTVENEKKIIKLLEKKSEIIKEESINQLAIVKQIIT